MMIQKINLSHLNEIYDLEKNQQNGYSLDQIEFFLQDNNYVNYAYILDNKIIGYIITTNNCDFFELIKIYVAADFRRKKIAQKLLNFFIEENKVNELILEVNTNNLIAINFYLKNNFQIINTRKKYYNNLHDAYVMKKIIL